MKCEECKFYKERHFQYNGWCRRYPPICDRKLELCTWPTISYDGWCGMFEPAEPEPQPAPQFDAENVKQLIGNLMGSVYYKATINDWFVESQKRAAEIVENDKHALLTALGLEDTDD